MSTDATPKILCQNSMPGALLVPAAQAAAPARRRRHPGDPRWHHLLTARWRRWPDFLILGAQRGGTTSLFRCLEQHPDVQASRRKEIHYFDYQFQRGPHWYRAHFPIARKRPGRASAMAGEASPYYLACPQAPRRAFSQAPHARLIALLRDPAERAWSHYRMARFRGHETLSFEEALRAEPDRLRGEFERLCADDNYYSARYHRKSYMERGVYLPQILRWLEYYPREQILLIQSETFYRNPAAAFARVCRFLGIANWQPPVFEKYNGQSAEPMPGNTETWLRDRFRAPNAELAAFLGWTPDWDRGCPTIPEGLTQSPREARYSSGPHETIRPRHDDHCQAPRRRLHGVRRWVGEFADLILN